MRTSDDKKAKAIADYLSHGNVSKAAADNEVDRSTLHRWLQKDAPDVKAAKGAIMDRIYDDIVSLLGEALSKLRARMKDDNLAAPQLAILVGILADKAARHPAERRQGVERAVDARRLFRAFFGFRDRGGEAWADPAVKFFGGQIKKNCQVI